MRDTKPIARRSLRSRVHAAPSRSINHTNAELISADCGHSSTADIDPNFRRVAPGMTKSFPPSTDSSRRHNVTGKQAVTCHCLMCAQITSATGIACALISGTLCKQDLAFLCCWNGSTGDRCGIRQTKVKAKDSATQFSLQNCVYMQTWESAKIFQGGGHH